MLPREPSWKDKEREWFSQGTPTSGERKADNLTLQRKKNAVTARKEKLAVFTVKHVET